MSPLSIDEGLRLRLKEALFEDIGDGDLTTQAIVNPGTQARGRIYAKDRGIFCGFPVMEEIYRLLDETLTVTSFTDEGDEIKEGDLLAEVVGEARQILHGERLSLNLMSRMSGVATLTRQFVDRMNNPDVALLDTRKTMPLWRALDKYAVRAGGGQNHRIGLFDMILIKENHIAMAGGVWKAIQLAKENRPEGLKIEVEVRNMEETREALQAGPDFILLDNFRIEQMREAVALNDGSVQLEASGGVTLDNVEAIAETGVDRISVGALTHSTPATDFSMIIKTIST